jgi:hydroxymethylpyrimidine kinase/phosphomethylpyrimidine kinase
VVDPVLVASTGHRLTVVAAVERLLPYATVATPNVEEAAALVGWRIETPADMARAAGQLAAGGPTCVVVTGGDLPGETDAVDVVWTERGARFLRAPRVATGNTHGTGCTFSAAVAARLAAGSGVLAAVEFAKSYVGRTLAGASRWRLGRGAGPVDHFEWSYAAG